MAIAGKTNIAFDEGCDLDIDWTWTDEAGDPIPLDGYVAKMHVKEKLDGDIIIDWSQYLTVNEVVGTVRLTIPACQLEDIGINAGVYGIKLFSPDGKVFPFLKGTIKINQEIVRICQL